MSLVTVHFQKSIGDDLHFGPYLAGSRSGGYVYILEKILVIYVCLYTFQFLFPQIDKRV